MSAGLDPKVVEIANAMRRQLKKLDLDCTDACEAALLVAAGFSLDEADGDSAAASDALEVVARDVVKDVRMKKITVVACQEPTFQ